MARHSTEAMTGRGLRLVASIAGRLLELWDDDGWFDDEAAVTRHTVTLGDVPTSLLLSAKAHVDNRVPEFALISSRGLDDGVRDRQGTQAVVARSKAASSSSLTPAASVRLTRAGRVPRSVSRRPGSRGGSNGVPASRNRLASAVGEKEGVTSADLPQGDTAVISMLTQPPDLPPTLCGQADLEHLFATFTNPSPAAAA